MQEQMHSYGRSQGWIGASVRRKEDGRLLTGEGRYVDDLHLPGTLHMAVLRSPHAHARIRHVDLAAARAAPGVIAVADGAAVRERLGVMLGGNRKQSEAARLAALDPHLLPVLRMETQPVVAVDKVRYAGEALAVVLAESRYQAEDALHRVVVD